MSIIHALKSKVASLAACCAFISTTSTCTCNAITSRSNSSRSTFSAFSFPPQRQHRQQHRQQNRQQQKSSEFLPANQLLATSTSIHVHNTNHSTSNNDNYEDNYNKEVKNIRTYKTNPDLYFQKHGKIPPPTHVHVGLEQLMEKDLLLHSSISNNSNSSSRRSTCTNNNNNNILIIGDVHGCLNELKKLVQTSIQEYNNNQPFKCIILVGDLCNKGPYSAQVIQYVREQPFWYTVRGNHDDGALAAALGDKKRRNEKRYDWLWNEEEDDEEEGRRIDNLSDEDIEWLSNIPYTITIPKTFWKEQDVHKNINVSNDGEDNKEIKNNDDDDNNDVNDYAEDIYIVHAGLIPNCPLESQDIKTMVTVRDVHLVDVGDDLNVDANTLHDDANNSQEKINTLKKYAYFQRSTNKDSERSKVEPEPEPWAKAWKGPQIVIFGHDAKRGLQLEEFAIGLDTGCTYGNKLSAVILPQQTIVSVDAEKVHSPITA
jgi:hypothetical protein